jgi:hypothetical protein
VLLAYMAGLLGVVGAVAVFYRRSRKYLPDDMLKNNLEQFKYRILCAHTERKRKKERECMSVYLCDSTSSDACVSLCLCVHVCVYVCVCMCACVSV